MVTASDVSSSRGRLRFPGVHPGSDVDPNGVDCALLLLLPDSGKKRGSLVAEPDAVQGRLGEPGVVGMTSGGGWTIRLNPPNKDDMGSNATSTWDDKTDHNFTVALAACVVCTYYDLARVG